MPLPGVCGCSTSSSAGDVGLLLIRRSGSLSTAQPVGVSGLRFSGESSLHTGLSDSTSRSGSAAIRINNKEIFLNHIFNNAINISMIIHCYFTYSVLFAITFCTVSHCSKENDFRVKYLTGIYWIVVKCAANFHSPYGKNSALAQQAGQCFCLFNVTS